MHKPAATEPAPSYRSEFFYWTACLGLLAAPLWAAKAAQIAGHNTFIVWDAAFMAGAGLLFARLFQWLPDAILPAVGKWTASASRNLIWLGPVLLAALLAGLMLVNRRVLHSFMNSADEHSCLFLAQCLNLGRWRVEPHPLSEFFNVVHVGNRDGKWFSVYPPGWPALLAFGLRFQIQDWLNPVMSCISLVFLYLTGRRVFGKTAAWTGLLLVSLSPFFMFTSASYFSHATCLLAIAVFLYAFLRWMEARDAGRGDASWAVLAAFAAGYGLNTRYLTMAAFLAPFILWHGLRLLRRQTAWKRSDTIFAALLGFSVLLTLAHNHVVTGKFWKAPNQYDKSWERLGFRGEYTPVVALIFIVTRFFYLSDWLAPLLIGLFLTDVFKKSGEPLPGRLIRFGFWYPVLAYIFYFSWGGNQYGPRYYYEGLPLLGLALGAGLRSRWQRGGTAARKFLLGLVIFSLFNNGYLFYKQGRFFSKASSQRKALYDLADRESQKPALIFIRGFLGQELVMAQEDAIRNDPGLKNSILYAHDLGPDKNRILMQQFPDRTAYRGTFDRSALQARLERVEN